MDITVLAAAANNIKQEVQLPHHKTRQLELWLRNCPDLNLVHYCYLGLDTEGCSKKKERKSIYIAPFIYYIYLKALRR